LRKDIDVKAPFEAVETCHAVRQEWYELKPEIFKENSLQFKQKVLSLHYQTLPRRALVFVQRGKPKQDCLPVGRQV